MKYLNLHLDLEAEDGFTLIEIMVVVLIIGVLSVIALPVYLSQRKTAETAGLIADAEKLNNAVGQVVWQSPSLKASDFSHVHIGDESAWELYRVSQAGYCITVWNINRVDGIGSKANPVYIEDKDGQCASQGVEGTHFAKAL